VKDPNWAELVEIAVVTQPSYLEGQVVLLTTCVPSCKVPTELLAILVGSAAWACYVSSGQLRPQDHTIEGRMARADVAHEVQVDSAQAQVSAIGQSQPC
jgi:hypothetical protein